MTGTMHLYIQWITGDMVHKYILTVIVIVVVIGVMGVNGTLNNTTETIIDAAKTICNIDETMYAQLEGVVPEGDKESRDKLEKLRGTQITVEQAEEYKNAIAQKYKKISIPGQICKVI